MKLELETIEQETMKSEMRPAAMAAGFAFGIDPGQNAVVPAKCDHGFSQWLPKPIV
jgi:hypothetical protein